MGACRGLIGILRTGGGAADVDVDWDVAGGIGYQFNERISDLRRRHAFLTRRRARMVRRY
ncbi:hypothetical protein CU103_06205 [Phyllobacterium sophorae]|uniref:Uncharacterized protein n=1 Tax=Phyllobacterium sophorae TaxID=1520277 RepID=A0A2P7BI73_9HYPH|nr:hypothetical protein CU103_06205 [Phyllobacterium sophorae]